MESSVIVIFYILFLITFADFCPSEKNWQIMLLCLLQTGSLPLYLKQAV